MSSVKTHGGLTPTAKGQHMQPRTFAAVVVLSIVGRHWWRRRHAAFTEGTSLIWHDRFETDGGWKGVDDD